LQRTVQRASRKVNILEKEKAGQRKGQAKDLQRGGKKGRRSLGASGSEKAPAHGETSADSPMLRRTSKP
jgi:hypothetical protein